MKRSKWATLRDKEINEFLEYLGVPLSPPITRVEIVMDVNDIIRIKTWRLLKIGNIKNGIKYQTKRKVRKTE